MHNQMAVLTGDLNADKVREVISVFPEATGFGIGTKLISEVESVAGVIFKQSVIDGLPTMKISSTLSKSTLPGFLQVFRGSNDAGQYVGDVVGLDEEEIEISGASKVERLLVPFWEEGYHEPIP